VGGIVLGFRISLNLACTSLNEDENAEPSLLKKGC
jgi:hypothetical protein